MLLRMYSRFADRNGYGMELVERQEGDEAGIKSATFLLSGRPPVRIPQVGNRCPPARPDLAVRRQQASPHVVRLRVRFAEIDDNVDIKINESDLKVDTLRSGGAGGST